MTAITAAWLTLVALVAVLALPTPASANTTLTVNSTDDRGDTSPGDGVCRTAAGTCSLRAAVEEANALAGPDTIRFGISGGDVHTINLTETLVIQDRSGGTTIDGYTQSGARPNTASVESNARIKIEITTGSALAPMLLITSPGNTVRGIAIYGNGPRIELRGEDADGNRIMGNFIGTNADATATSAALTLGAADVGVAFNLGPDRNLIGSADLADRNVISGNFRYGVRINHGETSQNTVENNIIGLTPDLQSETTQGLGIDIQWWSWGNVVANNLISGHRAQAIDLSHSTAGTTVTGNRIGTTGDGNGANAETSNRWGITFKDNPVNNYVGDNVIVNSREEALYHRHNYTGANTVVRNRIGVGSQGAALGNAYYAVILRGHDDLYQDNLIAYNEGGGVYFTDTTGAEGPHTNYPPEATLRNLFRQNIFHSNGQNPSLDIEDVGTNPNDAGDVDTGAQDKLNYPTITGIGPGEVYGDACAGCDIEVFVSGSIGADGTLETGTSNPGTGAGWIGRAVADSGGNWSLAHPHIIAGKALTTAAIDAAENTSETAPATVVPTSMQGSGSNAGPSLGRVASPPTPPRPPVWAPEAFTCSWGGGVLSWDDAGAAEYYVRTVDAVGTETYVGARQGTSSSVPNAASYRVVEWSQGFARSATCGGPGDGGGPANFSCSYAGGTLNWTDQGASTYYVRLVNAAGADTYFGRANGTSLSVPRSAQYIVIHWSDGNRNAATCPGPGEPQAFSCSYAGGTLSWTDQGASTYYVRLVNAAGADTYFGPATGTSVSVPASARYMVIYWIGGDRIAATCDGA